MRYLLIIAGFLILSSCTDNRIWEEELEIEEGKWSYQDSLQFTFNVKDTAQIYGLGITVEFTEGYPYENIYTKIKTILPDGEVKEALFSIELRKPNKRRSLSCKNDLCIADVFLQAPMTFVEEGEYTLRLFQHSRDESLPGIQKVGMYLESLSSLYKD